MYLGQFEQHLGQLDSNQLQLDIIDVSLRDGLQGQGQQWNLEQSLGLIQDLLNSGFRHMEITTLKGQEDKEQQNYLEPLLTAIGQDWFKDMYPDCIFSALVLNQAGLAQAMQFRLGDIAFLASASDIYAEKKLGQAGEQLIQGLGLMINKAKQANIRVRMYLLCAFDCPFEGKTDASQVQRLSHIFLDMGVDEVVLSDTSGRAQVNHMQDIFSNCFDKHDVKHFAVHFHNFYGQALANSLLAIANGIRRIDCSIAGIGKSPIASAADSGPDCHLASEALIFRLQSLGLASQFKLTNLLAAGQKLSTLLAKDYPYRGLL